MPTSAAASNCISVIRAMSALVAPSTLSVAIAPRLLSSHDPTPPPMPIPAIASAARPTSTRNCPIRSMNFSAPGDAASRVLRSNPASGNRALRRLASALGSRPGGRAMRSLVRYIAPGWIRPADCGKLSPTITAGPSAKPSPSRSGSSAITPATLSFCAPMANVPPVASPSRATAPSATHAEPDGGAPTLRPSCSVRRP